MPHRSMYHLLNEIIDHRTFKKTSRRTEQAMVGRMLEAVPAPSTGDVLGEAKSTAVHGRNELDFMSAEVTDRLSRGKWVLTCIAVRRVERV